MEKIDNIVLGNEKTLEQDIKAEIEKAIFAYENKKTSSYYNSVHTIGFLLSMKKFVKDYGIVFVYYYNNIGKTVESIVNSFFKETPTALKQADTDIVRGGKRYELKVAISGSTSLPSSLQFEKLGNNEDLMVINQNGVFIVRNENATYEKLQGHLKTKENKIKPSIVKDKSLVVETPFTKDLTQIMNLGYDTKEMFKTIAEQIGTL